jgi:aspartyl/asparaginyl-tRNA synthetase
MSIPHLDPIKFDKVAQKLRDFFRKKGFVEAYTQNRLSILAACEDPSTISVFSYAKEDWPLIQTNQMWLEHLLLKDPSAKGFYCLSTSYRNEPNPVEGRHALIFPLFEFESKGDMNDLIQLEKEMLVHLGFQPPFFQGTYAQVCEKYGVDSVEDEEETKLKKDYGPVFFLTDFSQESSPFWNMKRAKEGTSNKVDVILHGIETFGSAERSCSPEEMREEFHTISGGEYAQTLYDKFGKERVEKELEEFLALPFFPRYGGGIGMTRLIRGMELAGLLK